MDIEQTENVVFLYSNSGENCRDCDYWIDSSNFEEGINHYLSEHGYTLLHVGTETTTGSNGEPWHSTVAALAE